MKKAIRILLTMMVVGSQVTVGFVGSAIASSSNISNVIMQTQEKSVKEVFAQLQSRLNLRNIFRNFFTFLQGKYGRSPVNQPR